MKKLILVIAGLAILSGCAAPKPSMYYWGDYTNSLYACKKNPCDESRTHHKETLLNIISESEKLSLKVPPGIYCELGYLMVNTGEKETGKTYLLLEKETYPESTAMVDRLLAKI